MTHLAIHLSLTAMLLLGCVLLRAERRQADPLLLPPVVDLSKVVEIRIVDAQGSAVAYVDPENVFRRVNHATVYLAHDVPGGEERLHRDRAAFDPAYRKRMEQRGTLIKLYESKHDRIARLAAKHRFKTWLQVTLDEWPICEMFAASCRWPFVLLHLLVGMVTP